ncbi:6780_t:CDS:1, partial [Ambispora leptoticha]
YQERLIENQVLYQLTSDKELKTLVKKRIQTDDKSIKEYQTRLKQLKHHTEAQCHL